MRLENVFSSTSFYNNAAQETLQPLGVCLVNEIEFINTAHADPEVRGLRLSSMRGGDESQRPPVVST